MTGLLMGTYSPRHSHDARSGHRRYPGVVAPSDSAVSSHNGIGSGRIPDGSRSGPRRRDHASSQVPLCSLTSSRDGPTGAETCLPGT
jgi:hypothetical protein